MNAKAYRINAMSLCIGIYLNVYANKRSYDTWRGTSMLGRKARETLPRGHRRRVVLRVTQWNTGVATARASGRQTARAKCVHQKRGLERSQSSFKRAGCQWVFSLEAVNHNCRPGSTEKRSVSMFLLGGLLQNATNIHAEHVLALSLWLRHGWQVLGRHACVVWL